MLVQKKFSEFSNVTVGTYKLEESLFYFSKNRNININGNGNKIRNRKTRIIFFKSMDEGILWRDFFVSHLFLMKTNCKKIKNPECRMNGKRVTI